MPGGDAKRLVTSRQESSHDSSHHTSHHTLEWMGHASKQDYSLFLTFLLLLFFFLLRDFFFLSFIFIRMAIFFSYFTVPDVYITVYKHDDGG